MNDEELISKTQLKKIADEQQDLGVSLLELGTKQWAQLPISDTLLAALKEAERIKDRGAMKRHRQYIGKVMRDEDHEAIAEKLAEIRGDSPKAKAQIRRSELWREKLLSNENGVLDEIIGFDYEADIQRIRQLVRNAQKQSAENPVGTKASKELFQYLKSLGQE